MAITTVRANQVTYDSSLTGGTRLAENVQDVTEFMDAPDRRDTPFLNSIDKGGAVSQRKHEWGQRAVPARTSTVAAGGLADAATGASSTLNVAVGHGARFQQGHVLELRQVADTTLFEHVWVSADPVVDALTVIRGIGGTTTEAFAASDTIKIIGIAMPENSDFPLGPVVRGERFYNFSEKFETLVSHSEESENTQSMEIPGDPFDYDVATKAGDLKLDLEQSLINGRRHEGTPDPSAARPSLLGGLVFWAEQGGNITNVGGSSTLLNIYHLEEALATMDESVGDNAGSKIVMSLKTKRIFNRMLNNSRELSGSDTAMTLRWDRVTLETGDYQFTHFKGFPDNTIVIYNPTYCEYRPYKGMDWKQKEVETAGAKRKRAVYGRFTFEAQAPSTMAIIRNFSTTLASYPSL